MVGMALSIVSTAPVVGLEQGKEVLELGGRQGAVPTAVVTAMARTARLILHN